MEGKKNKLKPPGAQVGLSGLRPARGHQVVSIYFIFAFHETTKVSIFLPPFSWNHPKLKKKSMKPGHKKKNEWFPIKTMTVSRWFQFIQHI